MKKGKRWKRLEIREPIKMCLLIHVGLLTEVWLNAHKENALHNVLNIGTS